MNVCDRCSAAAKVGVLLLSGAQLQFCRHHFNKNRTGLEAAGAVVMELANA